MGKIRLDEQATPATPPTGFAEIFVDSADKHLKQIDDAGAIIDLTEGGGGFQGLGLWRYRTATDANPTAGRLQFDDTTVDDATEMYINVLNDGGTDLTAFLALLVIGDLIYIQAQDDATQFIAVEIGGTPTIASGVYTFPIAAVESQGLVMTNNEVVAVLGSHSGGNVHDPVTLAGAPDYITLAGQVITRALINLTTHITAILGIVNGGTGSATAGGALSNLGAQGVSEKGNANGYAGLDGGGKVPVAQIPATALPEVHVVADAAARIALTVQEGDEAIQTDDGSHWIWDGAAWFERPGTTTFPLEVQDETVSLTLAAKKINFAGAGVTATEPVADEILVTIPGGGGGGAAEYANYYANAQTLITGVATTVGLDINRQETSAFTRSGDEVTINTPGDYAVQYDVTLDEDSSPPATIEAWLELNSVEIAGTRGRIYHDDPNEEGSTHALIIATLAATDVIRIRAQRIASSEDCNTHANGVRLSFFSIGGNGATGAQGIQGVPGSGTTLNIQDEGTPIPNTPHDAINFIGPGVVASDAGGGVADVTIGGVTTLKASATATTTTTSGTDVVISGLVLTPGPGDYVVMMNSSWENSDAEDMFVSVYVNGVQVADSERKNEMESSTPDTELTVATQAYVTGVLAAQDIDIRWRTTGGTLTMLQRSMILLKVA